MIRWWSDLDDDERWALYVTAPAFALALPVYCVATVVYVVGREAFGHGLAFIEACEGVVLGEQPAQRDVA